MSKVKSKVISKPIYGDMCNIYIMEAILYYPSVHKPKLKYQSTTEKEYCVTIFVDEATKDELEDTHKLNKTFAKVGVDKNKKKAIKFPLSSQTEEGKANYDEVDGLWGFTVTCPSHTKAKEGKPSKKRFITVLDDKNEPLTDDVGNGSKGVIKLFGYLNQDGLITVSLETIKVLELVAYEGTDGKQQDDVLGSYSKNYGDNDETDTDDVDTDDDYEEATVVSKVVTPKNVTKPAAFDDDIPF